MFRHRPVRRLFCAPLLTRAALSGCELLSTLAAKFGQPATFRREANLALMEATLAELGKVVPIIILDETQSFSYGSLEQGRPDPTLRRLGLFMLPSGTGNGCAGSDLDRISDLCRYQWLKPRC
jgi:hypothetical protein